MRGHRDKLPIYLKPFEVSALLEVPTNLRDRLILRLLYFCGLRISEALGLHIEDVDVLDRVIKICHALTRDGRPKEGKERLVPVDIETVQLIVELAGERVTGRLFNIGIRWIQMLIKRYARTGRIRDWKRVSPHKLRHSFAVHWVKRGGDLERLRRILGHSSLDTTQVYLRFMFDDVRREYDRIIATTHKTIL